MPGRVEPSVRPDERLPDKHMIPAPRGCTQCGCAGRACGGEWASGLDGPTSCATGVGAGPLAVGVQTGSRHGQTPWRDAPARRRVGSRTRSAGGPGPGSASSAEAPSRRRRCQLPCRSGRQSATGHASPTLALRPFRHVEEVGESEVGDACLVSKSRRQKPGRTDSLPWSPSDDHLATTPLRRILRAVFAARPGLPASPWRYRRAAGREGWGDAPDVDDADAA